MKKDKRSGRFYDLYTGQNYPLNWAGHWGNSRREGVLIPIRSLPRIDLEVDKLYRVVFDCVDMKNFTDHHVDEFVRLVGISGVEDPTDKRKHHRYATFESVTNFEVLKYERSNYKEYKRGLPKDY